MSLDSQFRFHSLCANDHSWIKYIVFVTIFIGLNLVPITQHKVSSIVNNELELVSNTYLDSGLKSMPFIVILARYASIPWALLSKLTKQFDFLIKTHTRLVLVKVDSCHEVAFLSPYFVELP